MRHVATILILCLVSLSVYSCSLLSTFSESQKVVSTSDLLMPGELGKVIPRSEIPSDITRHMPPDVDFVIVDPNQLVPGAHSFPVNDLPSGLFPGSFLGQAVDVLGIFFPGLAAIEGASVLLSNRKRKNYGRVISALNPANRAVSTKEAVSSLAAAMGWAHTSDASKRAANGEDLVPGLMVSGMVEREIIEG